MLKSMLRRRTVVSLFITAVCLTVAISIPIIVSFRHKTTQATDNQLTLACEFVGTHYQHLLDFPLIWQVYLTDGEDVIATWEEIYPTINRLNPLGYDSEHLMLTEYGLAYRGVTIPANYTSTVTYKGLRCTLTLP